MTYEPQTQAAIDRICAVILKDDIEDLDQLALEDSSEWVETAEDHQIESVILLCAGIRVGEIELSELWRTAFGDFTSTPEYRLAFSKALFELVALGAKQVEAA